MKIGKAISLKALVSLMFTLMFFAGVAGTGYYYLVLQPQLSSDRTVENLADEKFGWKFPVAKFPQAGNEGLQLAYSNIRDPGGVPRGLPVRLKIPSIGVNSVIEDALITPDGRMDVPAGSRNVAWFARGPHPGDEGSAVIAGHFGVDKGVPKVFFNLDKLRAGDKVYVEDDSGKTLAFVVRRTQSFDRNADATSVFTSGDGIAHLNIITCEGIWNQVNDTYPTRLVVFTDSIPGEGPIQVKAEASVKPMFPAAAKTVADPAPSESPEMSPTDLSLTEEVPPAADDLENSPGPVQTLIASVKSLYSTPMDAVITSVLVLVIVFIAFKIIRR